MFRRWQVCDKIHCLILSWILWNWKSLQQIVRFVSHELDSMTSRTKIDVFFNIFAHVDSEILFFNKSNVFLCSKWSAYESSWFCFRNSLLSKFEKIYHLFFQRNKSFSMFHLKDESKSIFLRMLFEFEFSRFIESWRFAFSFSLSCFIDAFSTKDYTRCVNESDCCRINNTMRSFKNEALNVVFLLETFFIHFRNAKSSLFATFSKRSFFELLLISRDNDLKNFFFFKILFTIATIFFF
jgi:hypothetical protein